MQFAVTENPLTSISADVVVLFAFSKKDTYEPTKDLKSFAKESAIDIEKILTLESFDAKKTKSILLYTDGKILAPRIMVMGLGEKKDFDHNVLREVIAHITKSLPKTTNSIALSLLEESHLSLEEQAQMCAEGVLLGTYVFANYKKKESDEKKLETVMLSVGNKKDIAAVEVGIELGEVFSQATMLARDLVNEQAAVATPTMLADLALDIAKKNEHVTCKIFDREEVEKMGMNAFLGIARGAETPPKFIYLHYKPDKQSNKKVALVGKGITFDTGGINVKPGNYMSDMKMDMAGGAAVLGVFSVLESIQPDCEVMGLIAATPNFISGNSIVPGDVVRALNGKTIEVLNTDAEGRVTMADSLSFAVKEGATEIIDLATLTGACMVALGLQIAGLMSNNEQLAAGVKKAAEAAGEKVWELPLPEEYRDINKSEVADVANIPNIRFGDAIAAGIFLREFVDDTPWVHLDIAGPAFTERDYVFGQKGGTGFGVRLLLSYLRNSKA